MQLRVGEQGAQKTDGAGILFTAAWLGTDRQSVARTRHSDVEQTTLLLALRDLRIRLQIGISTQFLGKFEERLPITRRETSRVRAQNEDVLEFKPLGRVRGHQTDNVGWGLRVVLGIDVDALVRR